LGAISLKYRGKAVFLKIEFFNICRRVYS